MIVCFRVGLIGVMGVVICRFRVFVRVKMLLVFICFVVLMMICV